MRPRSDNVGYRLNGSLALAPAASRELRVLLVEDSPGDARLVREMFAEQSHARIQLSTADSLAAAVDLLSGPRFDAMLADLHLPDSVGLQTFVSLQTCAPALPIVVLTGQDDSDLALRAMHAGAQDYLVKDRIGAEMLVRVLRYAIERHQHQLRWQFLAGASAALASSLDLERILQAVADLAVSAMADVCLVDVVQPDGTIERVGLAAEPPLDPSTAAKLRGRFFAPADSTHGVPRVLRTGEPELIVSLAHEVEELFPLVPLVGSADPLPVLARLQPRSRIVVPMRTRGRVAGCLTLLRTASSDAQYGAEDVTTAEYVAERAALALDNARLYSITEQAVRVRDDVLRFVSHDFKNALSKVRLSTELLLESIEDESATSLDHSSGLVNGEVRRIDSLALSMWGLADELLDVARLHAGQKLPIELRQADLVSLVREAVAQERGSAPGHDLNVSAPDRPLLGTWDIPRVRRVIDNLLSNAIKYSPAGGPIHIRLEEEREGDSRWAVLAIRDRGIGIPHAEIGRVFEPFFRATNVNGTHRGTGIGLAGARHIVEQHGGRIALESAEGRGTTVTVWLRLLEEAF